MVKLNSSVMLVLMCSLIIFLGGCSSTSVQTDIINVPDQKWRITSVLVSENKDGWRVAGRLNSPNIFGLPDGHILVSILSEDGVILDQKKTDYRRIPGGAGRHRRHQFGVALFAIDFKSIPENANVLAEFHINKPELLSKVVELNCYVRFTASRDRSLARTPTAAYGTFFPYNFERRTAGFTSVG